MPDHNATRFFTLRCNYDNCALGWEHWGRMAPRLVGVLAAPLPIGEH
jgi:hypothetical protein